MKNLKFEKVSSKLTKEEMKMLQGGTDVAPGSGNFSWDTTNERTHVSQIDNDNTPKL